MPRPTIALLPEIEQWIKDQYCYEHKTAEELVQALANEHGIEITLRTLQRKLQEWGCKKQTRVDYTFELVSRFLILFYQMVLDDKTITYILNVEGMSISHSNVARLRRKLGIRRRVRAGDYDIAWDELIAVVEREFHEGMLRNYGRNFLYAHFRRSQYLVSRYRLWEAVRIVDPEGIALRTGDANRKRGSYEVPGPNWIWSLDGYCKLELVGIQIYAAIDAFSRMVLWIYVGISGRTAVSVKRQYLDVLYEGFAVPKALRTDHGGETTMLADAHFRISKSLRTEDEETLRFIDCFLFGTSTANQRIEAWWGQLTKGQMSMWRAYFERLIAHNFFSIRSRVDRIAFNAIYIPVIRKEVHHYMCLWNNHTIRNQRKRPNVVAGKPFLLYNYPELSGAVQCGMPADPAYVEEIREEVADWDIDEFLPKATKEWCDAKLLELGHDPARFHTEDLFPDGTGERTHCRAYLELREAVREHVAAQAADAGLVQLSLSMIPRGAWRWRGNREVVEAFDVPRETQRAEIPGEGPDEEAVAADFEQDMSLD